MQKIIEFIMKHLDESIADNIGIGLILISSIWIIIYLLKYFIEIFY